METCERCNGTGQLKAYGHVQNGVCFLCSGTGEVKPKKASKPSSKSIQKEQERLAKVAEFNRKTELAKVLYAGETSVDSSHPYYYAHAIEMAKQDNVWETL